MLTLPLQGMKPASTVTVRWIMKEENRNYALNEPYFDECLKDATVYNKIPKEFQFEDPRSYANEKQWRDLLRWKIGFALQWAETNLHVFFLRIWVQDGDDGESQECYNHDHVPKLEWTEVQELVDKASKPIFRYAFDFYTPEEVKQERHDYEFFDGGADLKIATDKILANMIPSNTDEPAATDTAATTSTQPTDAKQAFQAKVEDGDEAK